MLTRKTSAGLAVLVAALFVVAFAAQAGDYGKDSASVPMSYTGKIVGIDSANKLLTVEAGPKEEAVFEVRDDASLTMCDKKLSFSDLTIGDTVTISFVQESLGALRSATGIETGKHC